MCCPRVQLAAVYSLTGIFVIANRLAHADSSENDNGYAVGEVDVKDQRSAIPYFKVSH
jgi:hypothetical protein